MDGSPRPAASEAEIKPIHSLADLQVLQGTEKKNEANVQYRLSN
jgi:hypothetical protein